MALEVPRYQVRCRLTLLPTYRRRPGVTGRLGSALGGSGARLRSAPRAAPSVGWRVRLVAARAHPAHPVLQLRSSQAYTRNLLRTLRHRRDRAGHPLCRIDRRAETTRDTSCAGSTSAEPVIEGSGVGSGCSVGPHPHPPAYVSRNAARRLPARTARPSAMVTLRIFRFASVSGASIGARAERPREERACGIYASTGLPPGGQPHGTTHALFPSCDAPHRVRGHAPTADAHHAHLRRSGDEGPDRGRVGR